MGGAGVGVRMSLRLMGPSSGLWSKEGLALVYLLESQLPVTHNHFSTGEEKNSQPFFFFAK